MGNIQLSDNSCPICGEPNCSISAKSYDASFYYYDCKHCGVFFAPNPNWASYSEDLESNFDLQHLQSYLCYQKTNLRPVICKKSYFDKHTNDGFIQVINITPEIVEGWYPKSFANKIDLILLKLYELSAFEGDIIRIFELTEKLFFLSPKMSKCVDEEKAKLVQLEYILNYLEKEDYLSDMGNGLYQLTYKALERIYELQKNQSNNKNVFVAMQFGEETKKLREKIKEGLAGFNVRIMDEIEHNNQIVPEMLYEIRNSRFVVAELSHHNNGAYYEAGYALGLGKIVIHICQKEERSNNLHFDVAQVNTIFYDSIDEIPEKLRRRIKATIN